MVYWIIAVSTSIKQQHWLPLELKYNVQADDKIDEILKFSWNMHSIKDIFKHAGLCCTKDLRNYIIAFYTIC